MSLVWEGKVLTELQRAVLNAEISAGVERSRDSEFDDGPGEYSDPADNACVRVRL